MGYTWDSRVGKGAQGVIRGYARYEPYGYGAEPVTAAKGSL